jgi:dihydroorotase
MTVFRNARIVDAAGERRGDVLVEGGLVVSVAEGGFPALPGSAGQLEIIDAAGKILMPSFVDLHAHFRDPGFPEKETIETGLAAAVRGGYTAVNLMANTKPPCSSMETIRYVREKAEAAGLATVHQCATITEGMKGEGCGHIAGLSGVRFLSDDGRGVADAHALYRAMLAARDAGMVVIEHAESSEFSKIDMRLAEDSMTARDIELCAATGCPLHVAHVSTKGSAALVALGKSRGLPLTCEVTPHHLALTGSTNYRVNPPLRTVEDIEALIAAIGSGTIDCISTDHAPHTAGDKADGALGISGIETAFAICYTVLVRSGRIGLPRLSELMSLGPARIWGLNRGLVKPGFEAELVLLDTGIESTVDPGDFASKGKNTPFAGMGFFGRIDLTMHGGRIVYDSKKEKP